MPTSKIFKAINSYKLILGIDVGYYEVLNCSLSDNTKEYVENGDIHLAILAKVIKETMEEAVEPKDVDSIFWNKLHDQNHIIKIKQYLRNKGLM